MRSIPKRTVLLLQCATLGIAAFAIAVAVVARIHADYLLNEGLLIFIFLYMAPLLVVMAVLAMVLRRTFGAPHPDKPAGVLARLIERNDELTALLFPGSVSFLRATREMRPELARLHGDLLAGTEEQTRPAITRYIDVNRPVFLGTCGDVISKSMLDAGLQPDLLVIDGMTCRHDHPVIEPAGPYHHIDTVNVTGGITRESWMTVKDAIESGRRTVIHVSGGEEDLLLVPMVLLAPLGAIMGYGQPPVTDLDPPVPAGAVMVRVTPGTRQRFVDIARRFEQGNG